MKRLIQKLSVLLVALTLLAATLPASRAGAATCGFTAIAGLSFGAYDVFGPNVDTAGTIIYTCTGVLPGDNVVITLSIGGAPTYNPRQMQSGANRLDYNAYLDASRVLIWGDGTGPTSIYGPVVPPEGVPVNVPMFGRIPSGQDVAVGAYTDSVVITMIF